MTRPHAVVNHEDNPQFGLTLTVYLEDRGR